MSSFLNPPLISAYIICQDKFLILHRCGSILPNTWQMITGGVEPGETAWQAALREIKEETGIVPNSFYNGDIVESFYMLSQDKLYMVPAFVAYVSEETMPTLSPSEHDKFEWVTVAEAKDRFVWSEQKRILAHIYETFVLKKPSELLRLQ